MQPQIIFLLFGKINLIKADSNLPGSLSKRPGRCLKVELTEIKKPVPPRELLVSLK